MSEEYMISGFALGVLTIGFLFTLNGMNKIDDNDIPLTFLIGASLIIFSLGILLGVEV